MTPDRNNQFIVGLFVLAAITTLFIALALLTGRTGPTHAYYTLLDNVEGVKYGTAVVYEGFQIGQVDSVEPDTSGERLQFRLTLAVRRDWQIPIDSQAMISAPGVLAANTLFIRGGTSSSHFSPGDTLPSLNTPSPFAALENISRTFAELSQDGLMPLIRNLNSQVASAGELIRGDLQTLVRDLQTRAPAILQNVESFTQDLAAAGNKLDGILNDDNAAAIQRIVKNADQTSSQLSQMSQDIRKLLADSSPNVKAASEDLRFSLEAVARHIDTLTHNLDAASLQLLEFSRQIRNNPSTLLRGTEAASGEELRGPNQ